MAKHRISAGIMVLAFVGILVSIVLLLNFTAPNPTGRRYSSEVVSKPVVLSIQAKQIVGRKAEEVLAKDLKIANNNSNNIQCICALQFADTSTRPQGCTSCIHYMEVMSESGLFRKPDFVTAKYFIESKNVNEILYDGLWRDTEQLKDYIVAAKATHRQFWLFVRADSTIETELSELVETTGGGVVKYFRTSDSWVDPVDSAARVALLVSAVVLALGLLLWFMPPLRFSRRTASPKPDPKPSHPVEDAGDFLNRARDSARKTIDKEDSRPD